MIAPIGPGEADAFKTPERIRVTLTGSATVAHVHQTLERIRLSGGDVPDLDDLKWDDSKPLELILRGDLDDELDLLDWNFVVRRKVLSTIRPTRFSGLTAALALPYHAKRDPDVIDRYAWRKDGKESWVPAHPVIEPILAETYGLPIYDEQLFAILNAFTGWPIGSPLMWEIRRAMDRRDEAALAKQAEQFTTTAAGYLPADEARSLWSGFLARPRTWYSKSAAVAFAMVVFQTAYLKAYHGEAFDAASAET